MVERVSTKLNVCIMGKLNSYMRVWPLDCKVVERVSIPHELMLPVTHDGGGTFWMGMGLEIQMDGLMPTKGNDLMVIII